MKEDFAPVLCFMEVRGILIGSLAFQTVQEIDSSNDSMDTLLERRRKTERKGQTGANEEQKEYYGAGIAN